MILRCTLLGAVAAAPWTATQPGRPPHRIDAATANGLIRRRLAEVFNGRRRPFLVARLSLGAELSVAAEYADGRREDFAARPLLASHAGVHGPDEEAAVFAREYASALNASTIVAGFGGDAEARVARTLAPRAAFVEHRAVEPFYFGDEAWSHALRGRRVLIVHPFADTIRSQYAKHAAGKNLLWPEAVLPRDLDLVVVKAPSIAASVSSSACDHVPFASLPNDDGALTTTKSRSRGSTASGHSRSPRACFAYWSLMVSAKGWTTKTRRPRSACDHASSPK